MPKKHPYISILLLINLLLCLQVTYSQQATPGLATAGTTDSLRALASVVLGGASEAKRLNADSSFNALLHNFLKTETDFNKPLPLPPSIAVIVPTDRKFRLINWAIPLYHGKYGYRLIMQYYDGKDYKQITLIDHSAEPQTEKAIHTGDQWFGALYYKIIEKKYKGKVVYTLLGWNRSAEGFQTKLAEAVTFDEKHNQPTFGARIFPGANRYLVKYSSKASLSMRYTAQTLSVRRGLFNRLKTVTEEMIVYDRVNSSDVRFKNDPRFSYPAGNIFDALIWEKGRWVLLRDIDARNEARPADDIPRPDDLDLKRVN